EKGLTNHRCKKRPKLNAAVRALRLKFCQEYRYFNWKRRGVKFSDECSVQRGSGKEAEWCFRYPHGIWTLEWPLYSPDLNPIEHLWWALKKLAWDALRAALKEAWKKLPKRLIRQLIESMGRRLAAVRKVRGWQTKY
ncbi:hypothetical protein K469DRAFT_717923, partial [Zopfia rhizophila CBS 207.26]